MMFPGRIENAEQEMAAWKGAMRELRDAERQLDTARRTRDMHTLFALHARVDELRKRTALLLAKAVERMHEHPQGRSSA